MRTMKLILAIILLSLGVGFAQTVHLTPVPRIQFFDNNGKPLAGGFVYTYTAGTTTPLATYTDYTGGAANTNPIVLDSGGYANIWLADGSSYKLTVQNHSHVQLYVIDGISNPVASTSTFDPHSPPAIGDVLPNTIDGTTITAHTRFIGNLTGNVTGNLGGNVTGNVTGNLTGNVTGGVITGNGAFVFLDATNFGFITPGAIKGTTVEAISGFTGNLTGNVTGNLTGNATTATNAGHATTADTATALTNFQATNFGATCSTSSSSYTTCTSTYTIPMAYSDTSYQVSCTPLASITGHPHLVAITKASASTITATIGNGTADGAVVSGYGGLSCFFFHN